MPELCLVIRVQARKRDAERLLGLLEDYADEQFEAYTTEHGRPMNMIHYTEDAREHEKHFMALAEILEWYEGLPNDIFDGRPPTCIKRAYKIMPAREK